MNDRDTTEHSPIAPSPAAAPATPEELRTLAETLEREAAQFGTEPRALDSWLAAARLYEDVLNRKDKAAECYQRGLAVSRQSLPLVQAARRLFSELGNWPLASDLLEAEVALVTEPEELAAIHFERAVLFEEKLNQSAKAKEAYAQALKTSANRFAVGRLLVRQHMQMEEHLQAYELLDTMAAEVRDPSFRADFHRQLAFLAGQRLSHPEIAAAHQKAVVDREPQDPEARAALLREYRRSGNDETLALFVAQMAQKSTDPIDVANTYFLAAKIFYDRLKDEQRATVALRNAVAAWPDHLLAWRELGRIYEANARWTEAIDVYRLESERLNDISERAARLFRIGQIFEDRLSNEEQAAFFFRQVVVLRPTFLPALQSLGKLLYKRAAWPELIEMNEAEILATDELVLKVPKLFKLAEVIEQQTGDVERAVQVHERILSLDPSYMPSLKVLGRLYATLGRHDALIKMFESEIALTGDDEQKIYLLDKIAEIHETHQDLAQAIATTRRVLEINPSQLSAVRNLGRLLHMAGRFSELIELNESEASLVNDQKLVVALLHKNGELYEEKMNDRPNAVLAYRKVLALAPDYLPSLKALGRIYLAEQRFDELVDMYRQELEATSIPEHAATLAYKIGEIYDERLRRVDDAVVAYRRVLTLQPAHRSALHALTRLFEDHQRWAELVETFVQQVSNAANDQQKAVYWFKIGELRDERLKDAEGAIQAYAEAHRLAPEVSPSLTALVRLLEEKKDYTTLSEVLEREMQAQLSPSRRFDATLRLGGLMAHQMNDPERAIGYFESVLELQPATNSALMSLERQYLAKRQYENAVRTLEKLAERCSEPKLKVAYEQHAAMLRQHKLEGSGVENYKRMLRVDQRNRVALRALATELHRSGELVLLDAVYRLLLDSASPESKRALALDRGEIALKLGTIADDVLLTLEQHLQSSPNDLIIIRALRRLYALKGDATKHLALVEREGQATTDPELSARLLVDLGKSQWDKFSDADSAKRTLSEALRRRPDDQTAFDTLQKILRSTNDYRGLVELYEPRIETDADLASEAGEIYSQRLGDRDNARRCFSAVLRMRPERVESHLALAEMSYQSQDFIGAVEHYSRALSATTSAGTQVRIHSALAQLYAEQLSDFGRALAHVNAGLTADPANEPLLELSVVIHLSRGDVAGQRKALEVLVEVTTHDEARRHHMAKLGEILMQLGEEDAACTQFEKLLALDPSHASALDRLSVAYEKRGDWTRLIDVMKRSIETLAPEQTQTRAATWFRLGELQRDRLNDPAAAAASFKAATADDPQEIKYEGALAMMQAADPATQGDAVSTLRALLQRDPFTIDAYRALLQIYESQNQRDRAYCVTEVLNLMRALSGDAQRAFIEAREMAPQMSDVALTPAEHDKWILDPEWKGPIAQMLQLVTDQLSKVLTPDFGGLDLEGKLVAKSTDAVRVQADALAHLLGAPDFNVHVSNAMPLVVRAEGGDPLMLIVGRDFGKRTPAKEQRFALGRALESLRSGIHLLRYVGEEELAAFIESIVACVKTDYRPSARPERVEEWAKQLRAAVSRKAKKALEEPAQSFISSTSTLDPKRMLGAAERTLLRAGVCTTNDLDTVIRAVAREVSAPLPHVLATPEEVRAAYSRIPLILEALRFTVSDEYFAMRQHAGLAVE